MKADRVPHRRSIDEWVDELIRIAKGAGAYTIALDAVRSSERLGQARLFVAIVGNEITRVVERAA